MPLDNLLAIVERLPERLLPLPDEPLQMQEEQQGRLPLPLQAKAPLEP